MSLTGIVTFAFFTCQLRCILKDRTKENQSLGTLKVGAESSGNGLFLANVTTLRHLRRRSGAPAGADHGPGGADDRLGRRVLRRAGGARVPRHPLRQP